jgi:hypothetical protein
LKSRCDRARVLGPFARAAISPPRDTINSPNGVSSSFPFRAQKLLSSGVVEGLNNKAKVTMRKPYGFRTFRVLELALYHSLGKLPEPESTHDFF